MINDLVLVWLWDMGGLYIFCVSVLWISDFRKSTNILHFFGQYSYPCIPHILFPFICLFVLHKPVHIPIYTCPICPYLYRWWLEFYGWSMACQVGKHIHIWAGQCRKGQGKSGKSRKGQESVGRKGEERNGKGRKRRKGVEIGGRKKQGEDGNLLLFRPSTGWRISFFIQEVGHSPN